MAYPTDLTDDQWERVLELLVEQPKRGRPYPEDLRRVVDAMLYIARTGCQWRMLPADFPPWTRVWSQFRRWRTNGTWARVVAGLHRQVRIRAGREPDPSMLVADPTLVRGASHGGATFHNQGGPYGRTKGAKHTIAVDITGLPAAATAAPAGTSDGRAVEGLVEANPLGSHLELLIVDRGIIAGAQRRVAADRGVEVRVVGWDTLTLDAQGRRVFQPIPYAWWVEVAHALVGWHRRLAKSFENTISSATAWLQISCAALLLRHLAE
jgi:putative transposase